MKQINVLFFALLIVLFACNNNTNDNSNQVKQGDIVPPTQSINIPDFNSDTAYSFIEQQVAFGPRIPNTKGQTLCRDYIKTKMELYGFQVEIQTAQVKVYDGSIVPCYNIICKKDGNKKDRIMLSAHYDTRPWADQDIDPKKRKNQFDGANDGASGVAVLMEIARNLQIKPIDKSITILFWDVEDYGVSSVENSYCLGSQYWAKSIDGSKYQADYLINLDMVGAPEARFPKEGGSMYFAERIVQKVWNAAQLEGYQNYFVKELANPITDDHQYINELAKIPSIDIIDLRKEGGFPPTWHTTSDNLTNIDKSTLKAVGKTLLRVLYSE